MYGDAEIYVYPVELWKYAITHHTLISKNYVVIAEDSERGIEITVETNEKGSTLISVYISGDRVYSEPVISDADCVRTLGRIYSRFFVIEDSQYQIPGEEEDEDDEDEEAPVDEDDEDEEVPGDDEDEDDETIVEFREIELENAFTDFIEAVLYDDANDIGDKDFLEMLNDVLDVISLYRPVYAPRIVDGVLEEYPYNPEIDPENTK